MKTASFKTLSNNRKTRLSYAYNAIERELFCSEKEREDHARKAMDKLHKMHKSEMLSWALREIEWLDLNHNDRG